MSFRQKKSYAAVVSLLSVVNVLNVRKKYVLCDDTAAAANPAKVSAAIDEVNLKKDMGDVKAKHMKKENPFDCIKPACSSKMDMLQLAIKQRKNMDQGQSEETVSPPSFNQEPISTASNKTIVELSVEPVSTASNETIIENVGTVIESPPSSSAAPGCPLYIEELGRSSWDLIHTTAAYYPDIPTEEDKKHATNFMISMAYLYPCDVCRREFIESVEKLPPQ
jgi:hypothetical protein